MALKEENSFRYTPRVTVPETVIKSILSLDDISQGGQTIKVMTPYKLVD